MWRKMNLIVLTASAVFLASVLAIVRAQAGKAQSASPPAAEPAPSSGGKTRVGTYDGRAVALVWSSSETPSAKAWAQHRDELHRKGLELKKAGKQDTDEFKRIQREMICIQYFQHAIVFSTAPPESALKELQARLPAIAREAGVQVIVPRTDWKDPNVETVDVTDKLVAEFKPAADVRKMLAGFEKKPPITLEEVTRLRDF